MKKKHRSLNVYIRRYHRLPRKDQIFVLKVLGAGLLLLLTALLLVILLLVHILAPGKPADAPTSSTSRETLQTQDSSSSDAGSDDDTSAVSDPGSSVSEEDVQLLARLIQTEVEEDSWEALIASASVILNRVNHASYPDTVSQVINQEGQYPPVANGTLVDTPSEQALEAARYVCENGSQIPENVIFQSGSPQGSGVWQQIGEEYFCYE